MYRHDRVQLAGVGTHTYLFNIVTGNRKSPAHIPGTPPPVPLCKTKTGEFPGSNAFRKLSRIGCNRKHVPGLYHAIRICCDLFHIPVLRRNFKMQPDKNPGHYRAGGKPADHKFLKHIPALPPGPFDYDLIVIYFRCK